MPASNSAPKSRTNRNANPQAMVISRSPDKPSKRAPVEFIRPEVEAMWDRWKRIRAAVEGQDAVKALTTYALPMPMAHDISPENRARYTAYLCRAVWYNVAGRTLDGMAGYVFKKEPVVSLPADLQAMETNVDGSGVNLQQQAKAALRAILSLGRCGLLVDYPQVQGVTTQQQVNDRKIAPTIVLYQPEAITNWRTSVEGALLVLTMITLKESYTPEEANANEFEMCSRVQYRVLTLKDSAVTGRIFREPKDGGDIAEMPELAFTMIGKNGQPLKQIPFVFLGSVNNDPDVDLPPLLDMVELNYGHYRNSADYEEACYVVGQPTVWMSGLTQQWVEQVLKGKVYLGARSIVPLPIGGMAGILQCAANTMPMEAMKHKEEQMVAIGAKLITKSDGPDKTATEASMQHTSEVSTLTAAATNTFSGYKRALEMAGEYIGSQTGTIDFDLSEPLSTDNMTPEQATAVMAAWMGGLMDFEEARWQLKKCGWAWKDDKVVKENIEADMPPQPPPAAPGAGNIPPPKPGAKPLPVPPPQPAK